MKIKRYASATEIEKSNGTLILVSYNTPVAAWTGGGVAWWGVALVAEEHYSRTTSKHIGAFLRRHGLQAHRVPQREIAALLD